MAAPTDKDTQLVLELHNPYSHEVLFHVVVYWGSLPTGARLYLAFGQPAPRGPLASTKTQDLERAGVTLGDRDARKYFDTPLEERCGEQIHLDLDRVYCLSPNEHRKTRLPEMLIGPERPAVAALRLVLPKQVEGIPPQVDVVQMAGTRVVGGYTIRLLSTLASGQIERGLRPRTQK